MNAKIRLVCRVAGVLLLAAGAVKMMVEAIQTATFESLPSSQAVLGPFHFSTAAVGSFHISAAGIIAVVIGGLFFYLGFQAPGRPSP